MTGGEGTGTMDDELLTTREAAAYLRRSHRTLQHWRADGCGPPFLPVGGPGGIYLYRRSDLEAWLGSHEWGGRVVGAGTASIRTET